MINNRFPIVFAVLALTALGSRAHAAEAAVEVPAVATPGNNNEAQSFLGAKLLVCNTCHGADGQPRASSPAPVIWGQQENYLQKQMHDFQHGDRESDVMRWMVTALSPAEQDAAAAFFSKKSWPAQRVNAAASTPPAVAAVCQACHQQNFAGGVAAPRLAGQKYDYLVDTMRRYAEGERKNNADMMRMMEALAPAEREALAHYISSL